MEISQFKGFSELSGLEDPCFTSQWPFNSFDDQLTSMAMDAAAFVDNPHHLYSHGPVFDQYKPVMEPSPRPTKQLKTSSWNSCISSDQSLMNQNLHYVKPKEEGTVSSKTTIGFNSHTFPSPHLQFVNQNHHGGGGGKTIAASNTARVTTPQDHILAERKRREKLSQRFIALSALVPGLKKVTLFYDFFTFDMSAFVLIKRYYITVYRWIRHLFLEMRSST